MDIEQTRGRILGWMGANRKGEDSAAPCFWSIYSLNSIYSAVPKSGAALGHNYHEANLEESVDYLLERMNDSPHVRYYAVRLRASKKDQGIITNFPNPHFNKYAAENKIGSMPDQNQSTNFQMAMLGMMQKQHEDNSSRKEESTQSMIFMMQQMQQFQMESLEQRLTHKSEINKLKEENEGLKNASPESPLAGIARELKPEIRDFLRYKVYGNQGFEDDGIEGIGTAEADKPKPEEQQQLAEEGITLLRKSVTRPEELIWKLGVVLENLDADRAKSLLMMLQKNYEDVKKNESNEAV